MCPIGAADLVRPRAHAQIAAGLVARERNLDIGHAVICARLEFSQDGIVAVCRRRLNNILNGPAAGGSGPLIWAAGQGSIRSSGTRHDRGAPRLALFETWVLAPAITLACPHFSRKVRARNRHPCVPAGRVRCRLEQ